MTATGAAQATSPTDSVAPFHGFERTGLDGFRLMLQQKSLQVWQQIPDNDSQVVPQNSVMVLIGEIGPERFFLAKLEKFVRAGGAMLVASDRGGWKLGDYRFLPANSTKLSDDYYLGFSDCPVVQDFSSEHPLFASVTSLVMNRPGQLQVQLVPRQGLPALAPIAWYSADKHAQGPVAMAAQHYGAGRLLLVADHSLFINEMLRHGDNARFVSNVVDWLCEGGERRHLVIIENGKLLPTWQLGKQLPSIPVSNLMGDALEKAMGMEPPKRETIVQLLNRTLIHFQEEDGFNQLLHAPWQSLLVSKIRRWGLFFFSLIGICLILRWLTTTPWKLRSWWCRAPAIRARQSTQHEYGTALQLLAREFFASMGIDPMKEVERKEHMPRFQLISNEQKEPRGIPRGVDDKGRIVRRLRLLWRKATSSRPSQLSERQYFAEISELRKLHEMQKSGRIRFETPES